MWKLHRYYLREVATSAVLTFLVLFGIVLVSMIYRGIDRARGFSLLDAAKTTLYFAADTIPHLLSISLLFATVLTFARASQDREITAIRGAGISPRVAMASALLVGMAFSVIGMFALHYVIPKAHFNKYRVVAEGIRQLLINTGMTDDKISFNDDVMLTWQYKSEDGKWLDVKGVFNREYDGGDSGPLREGWFRADAAWMETDRNDERLSLVFSNLQHGDALSEELRIGVDLREIAERGMRREDEKDMTSDQLLAEVYRGVHGRPGVAYYQVHRRSCFALMPCLFAPLGFCIGVMSRSRGRMLALVFSLVPLFVFYASDFMGAKLVREFDMPSLAWTPALVMLILGVPFCWRLLRF